jgi:hypothetical protein
MYKLSFINQIICYVITNDVHVNLSFSDRSAPLTLRLKFPMLDLNLDVKVIRRYHPNIFLFDLILTFLRSNDTLYWLIIVRTLGRNLTGLTMTPNECCRGVHHRRDNNRGHPVHRCAIRLLHLSPADGVSEPICIDCNVVDKFTNRLSGSSSPGLTA